MQDLVELLKNNPYPGRGIVVGADRAGKPLVYYWIMGRSANSRNRIFSLTDDGIRTEAFQPELVEDPSLIIYHPVRTMGDALVVTNGDQTDTIVDKNDFVAGCLARKFEPDAPNFTPRISAILNADGSFALSILKSQDAAGACEGAAGTTNGTSADGGRCLREFFFYEGVDAGTGYFLSTYEGDGDPLPSFAGEPRKVAMADPDDVWAALNADNKISLYCNLDGGVALYNKHLGD